MSNVEDLPPEKVRDVWTEHVRRLLRQIPGCRHHVIEPDSLVERAITANLATWWKHERDKGSNGFTDKLGVAYLTELLKFIPGALQDWRPTSEQAMTKPEWWKSDEITGQQPLNPHVKGAIQNETEREEVIKYLQAEYPEFDEHLRMVANGVNPVHLKRKHQKAEARKILRDFEYGEKQHRASALTHTSTVTERNEFLSRFPKAIQDVYLWEAKTGWTVPWHPTKEGRPHHVTRMMEISRRKPELRAVIDAGLQLEKQWARWDLQSASRDAEKTARRRAAAEALLNPQKAVA
jgi:hypothetical protein